MRRRPRLEAVIAYSLGQNFVHREDAARALVEDLDEVGYVVIEKATRRREHREQDIDAARRRSAEDDRESMRAWAEQGHADAQRLRERCSFLYEKAVEHGASTLDLICEGADIGGQP